jgi:diacylglycerol kinase (ATP)
MNDETRTKTNKPFSLSKRLQSFKYAFTGIVFFFKQEHNARIHLLATITVIVLSVILSVSKPEVVALILSVGFVWASEIFNTAIEKIMDFISPEKNDKVKLIKDLSAAAVLIAAITALATGCIVFIPKL